MKSASVWESPPCHGMCMKWSDVNQAQNQMYELCRALLDDQNLLDALRNSNFDIVYSEHSDICAPGIWQLIGVKNFVLVSAIGMNPRLYDIVGLPTFPSFVPVVVTPFSDKMSFPQRIVNFNVDLFLRYYLNSMDNKFWRLFESRFPKFPTFDQILEEKTALIMINANEFAETARPTTNMIKYIGGSAIREPKALPEMNFGKPVIVIPMFADQQHNSKIIERNGLGVILEKHNLNKKMLTEALKKVLENKEMARKAALVASLLDGTPKKYRQEIARWARIIAEHGQLEHLKLYSRKLNWLQYYCLDVIAFEVFLVALVVLLVVYVLRRLVRYIRSSKVKSE
ncbi:UDP-glucoronosyl and UDP-glucosyl transferase [Oesophagostomum dentatum]|uniref:glucuronosyltransferase n=1 Tax=Oesophagostomum dentatum TaxID=61180 RepID=A0A0B1T8Z5_OESDE|nr:UDP-glucoronosyl and UDP-glucosyl transferase [Oesophagostomum dentatum]